LGDGEEGAVVFGKIGGAMDADADVFAGEGVHVGQGPLAIFGGTWVEGLNGGDKVDVSGRCSIFR
jgi:hypothetical protein